MESVIKNGEIIPKTASFHYELDPKFKFSESNIPKAEATTGDITKLLKDDEKKVFAESISSTEDLMANGNFGTFNGDLGQFLRDLRTGNKREFLVLLFLGKLENALKVPYPNPDLSTLVLLNRFNSFIERLNSFENNKFKLIICTENTFLDKYVVQTRNPRGVQTLSEIKILIKDFNLNNLELRPLEELVQKGYLDAFHESLEELKRNKEATMKTDEFKSVYDLYFLCYPAKPLEKALTMYTNQRDLDKIKEWTIEASMRYISFQKARYGKLDFWKYNSNFIRSTVSSKPGSVVFNYRVGRITQPHGIATVFKSVIKTEYFYDVAKYLASTDSKAKLCYYKNMPFYVTLDREIFS